MTQIKSLVGLFILILASGASDAYEIYNTGDRSREFHGEFCGACFHEWIPAFQSAACPGNETGCGGETKVYVRYGMTHDDRAAETCWARSPTAVPQHGAVYFYDDKVEVFDADGKLLKSSPYMFEYEYWGTNILKEVGACNPSYGFKN